MSARKTQEISEEERRFEDGTDPQVLDIIAIKMLRPVPQRHQKENHLIDDQHYWVKQGKVAWNELQKAIENPAGPLWINGYSSSHGVNDRIPEKQLDRLKRSLYLVRPDTIELIITTEGRDFGPPRRRVRAQFSLCDHLYRLVVTDPKIEQQYFPKPNNTPIKLKSSMLCISLAEAFHDFAYKLVAALITPERSEG